MTVTEPRLVINMQPQENWLDTPRKINMEPENHLLEKETNLPNLHFWVQKPFIFSGLQGTEKLGPLPPHPKVNGLGESGQIISTSAEVTLNGGLVSEYPQNHLNSD